MPVWKTLLGAAAVVVSLALVPTPPASAQISIGINIGAPPTCPYGYYDYPPYACAPAGYYGPGYFYNGVFLGVGPWTNWGYNHGWGHHRFGGARGGHYVPYSHGNFTHARPDFHGNPGPQHGNMGGHPGPDHHDAPHNNPGPPHGDDMHGGNPHGGDMHSDDHGGHDHH